MTSSERDSIPAGTLKTFAKVALADSRVSEEGPVVESEPVERFISTVPVAGSADAFLVVRLVYGADAVELYGGGAADAVVKDPSTTPASAVVVATALTSPDITDIPLVSVHLLPGALRLDSFSTADSP
ncbi:MAG TPA: hypothetical protein VFK89_02800 [Actinomycetota bacterium]|nr:hypothetical protein [Actinomycetota bacterium]